MEPLALRMAQVATLLGLGERTVFAMVARGELPAVTIVGKRRVLRVDLDRWLERQPKTTEAR